MLTMTIPKSQQECIQQAHKNLAHAEGYLREKTEALKDAQYREKIAREMRDEAFAALLAAQVG